MIDEKKLIESSTWYPNILFKEEPTWKDGWNNCNRDWMKRIDELPKVILPDTTITGWIPCSERLPKCNGCYLVWRPHFFGGEIGMPAICYFDGQDTWHDSYGVDFTRILNKKDVIAWMPLPEPYKESED